MIHKNLLRIEKITPDNYSAIKSNFSILHYDICLLSNSFSSWVWLNIPVPKTLLLTNIFNNSLATKNSEFSNLFVLNISEAMMQGSIIEIISYLIDNHDNSAIAIKKTHHTSGIMSQLEIHFNGIHECDDYAIMTGYLGMFVDNVPFL